MGTSICVGCGLCCDGSIFGFVPLHAEDDEATLRERGLTIVDRDGERGFVQRCVASCDGACTVYEDRPSVCRSYRCKLLKAHEAGSVSTADARRHIDVTKALPDEGGGGAARLVPARPAANLYAHCTALLEPPPPPGAANEERRAPASADSVAAAE